MQVAEVAVSAAAVVGVEVSKGCFQFNGQRLAGLQSQLRCGTQCGSCVPELRQIIRRVAVPA